MMVKPAESENKPMTSSAPASPRVSICFPTYNGAATVERALASLLAQTYRNYEIIISDDHSTDNTLSICERVAARDPKVRFVRPEHNLGSEDNMRFVLAQLTGKYFVWACQDDYWEPEFLECLVNPLEKRPTAVCAQGWVRWFSEDGSRKVDLRLFGRDLPETHSRLSLAMSIAMRYSREGQFKLKNNIFMHGMWRRDAFAAAIVAHGKHFSAERQILTQAALAGDFIFVDKLIFHKQFYDVELHERRPETDATVVIQRTQTRWGETKDMLYGIVRSTIVPLHMKVIAIPALSIGYFWYRSKMKNKAAKKLIQVWPLSR
jgi:glycosyltransferase involved in cell wall biosynthesis